MSFFGKSYRTVSDWYPVDRCPETKKRLWDYQLYGSDGVCPHCGDEHKARLVVHYETTITREIVEGTWWQRLLGTAKVTYERKS